MTIKQTLLAAAATFAMGTAALAGGPQLLTDEQMGQVVAGKVNDHNGIFAYFTAGGGPSSEENGGGGGVYYPGGRDLFRGESSDWSYGGFGYGTTGGGGGVCDNCGSAWVVGGGLGPDEGADDLHPF